MIENNLNNELLENDDVLKEENISSDTVDNINLNNTNNSESPIIETLDDNVTFTPVVSDGIFEEEILDFAEDKENDEVIEKLVDNNDLENKPQIIAEKNIDELNQQNNDEIIEEPLENKEEVLSENKLDTLNNESVVSSNEFVPIENIDNKTDFTNLDVENNNDSVNIENVNEIINEINNEETNFTNLEVKTNEQEFEKVSSSENNVESINSDVIDDVVTTKESSIENDAIDNTGNEKEGNDSEVSTDGVKEDTLLEKYGENFSIKEYVCNPAIGRDNEIKQLILTLLTPEKSGILVGKPGIGKTAIVEGLGYQIQKGNVPDALKEYQIYKLNTSSLLGLMPGTNEPKIQVLLNEIKGKQKLILFIDEIHTLIGAGADGDDSLDFANIFKPGLDRGNIKIIGATTSDEYDKYILTDKAFVRRFQKIDVQEPTKEHTVKIMMGSLPKLEHKTGAKLKYTPFIQEKIMTFIVDLTTEYRRVYELSARYPDVALTILQQAFSYAVFDNKKEVSIRDVRKAIYNTKLVYPDVIKKELVRFNEVFSDIYLMETPQRLKGATSI